MAYCPFKRALGVLATVMFGTAVWVIVGVSHFTISRVLMSTLITRETNQEVRMVLILTYMRSGSTFTGKLFDANPDAFYVFEPLYHIYVRALKKPNFMKHVAKSNGPFPVAENATLFARHLLQSYLTCDIQTIPVINFYDLFLKEGSKTKEFLLCGKSVTKCLDNLSLACNQSKIRAIKTIRLRMADVIELLENLPSLKVVHLLRDPRGIISSRKRHFGNYKKTGDVFDDVFKMCMDMRNDIASAERYEKLNSHRIMRLLYEDLAERPEAIAEQLYAFINSPQPESIREWIRSNTRAERDEELDTFLGTARKNSYETAYMWRSRISLHLSKYVDEKCQDVYQKLGYLPARDLSFLKNYSQPLRVKNQKRSVFSDAVGKT